MIYVIVFSFLFTATAFAAKPDRIPPSAPTNLRAVSVTDTSVSLAWSASYDKGGVKSYDIYMDSVIIGNTSTTSYNASGLTSAKTYKLFVKAKDTSGNISQPSNTLTVTTSQSIPSPTPEIKTSKVVGYYASWAAYSGFTPDKIDASKLTHINYAFANIGTDLKISIGDPDIDPSNFSKLITLKETYPNLKTIISVGGWSWSGKFSDAALTDASRIAFADSCVDFIVKYGFDGVDLDWEYPVGGGLSTNVNRPEDKTNFTLLLKKLRERLDARGIIDGRHYILSFAGTVSNSYISNTELGILQQYVDYGNIMTYDIHGTWDKYTDFNAPLYNNADTSPQYKWSVDSSINAWVKAGFPIEKLVMGVPFYGYKYNSVVNANNGLYQTYSGGSALTYANIAANYLNAPGYVRYYHPQSMVPWLFNGTTFISYEDEQSMGLKAQYIKSKGLGGAMIWELSQDPNRVLLNALYNGLK
jgi:chitinase